MRATILLDPSVRPSESDDACHIVWLRPDGHLRYMKRAAPSDADGVPALRSTIRLLPRHGDGEYTLQIYHFRLLVHEERFRVSKEVRQPPVNSP